MGNVDDQGGGKKDELPIFYDQEAEKYYQLKDQSENIDFLKTEMESKHSRVNEFFFKTMGTTLESSLQIREVKVQGESFFVSKSSIPAYNQENFRTLEVEGQVKVHHDFLIGANDIENKPKYLQTDRRARPKKNQSRVLSEQFTTDKKESLTSNVEKIFEEKGVKVSGVAGNLATVTSTDPNAPDPKDIAVVNAGNGGIDGEGTSGTNRALYEKCKVMWNESRRILQKSFDFGSLEHGQAARTVRPDGSDIYHARGGEPTSKKARLFGSEEKSLDDVYSATYNALKLAKQNEKTTVYMPEISTGAYSTGKEWNKKANEAQMQAIQDFINNECGDDCKITDIKIVVYDKHQAFLEKQIGPPKGNLSKVNTEELKAAFVNCRNDKVRAQFFKGFFEHSVDKQNVGYKNTNQHLLHSIVNSLSREQIIGMYDESEVFEKNLLSNHYIKDSEIRSLLLDINKLDRARGAQKLKVVSDYSGDKGIKHLLIRKVLKKRPEPSLELLLNLVGEAGSIDYSRFSSEEKEKIKKAFENCKDSQLRTKCNEIFFTNIEFIGSKPVAAQNETVKSVFIIFSSVDIQSQPLSSQDIEAICDKIGISFDAEEYKQNPEIYEPVVNYCKDVIKDYEECLKFNLNNKLGSINEVIDALGSLDFLRRNELSAEEVEKVCNHLGIQFNEKIYLNDPDFYQVIYEHCKKVDNDFEENLVNKFGEEFKSIKDLKNHFGDLKFSDQTKLSKEQIKNVCNKLGIEFNEDLYDKHPELYAPFHDCCIHIVDRVRYDMKNKITSKLATNQNVELFNFLSDDLIKKGVISKDQVEKACEVFEIDFDEDLYDYDPDEYTDQGGFTLTDSYKVVVDKFIAQIERGCRELSTKQMVDIVENRNPENSDDTTEILKELGITFTGDLSKDNVREFVVSNIRKTIESKIKKDAQNKCQGLLKKREKYQNSTGITKFSLKERLSPGERDFIKSSNANKIFPENGRLSSQNMENACKQLGIGFSRSLYEEIPEVYKPVNDLYLKPLLDNHRKEIKEGISKLDQKQLEDTLGQKCLIRGELEEDEIEAFCKVIGVEFNKDVYDINPDFYKPIYDIYVSASLKNHNEDLEGASIKKGAEKEALIIGKKILNGEELDQSDLDQLNYILGLPPIFKNSDFYKNNSKFYERPCELCKVYYVKLESEISTDIKIEVSKLDQKQLEETIGQECLIRGELEGDEIEAFCEVIGVEFNKDVYDINPDFYKPIYDIYVSGLLKNHNEDLEGASIEKDAEKEALIIGKKILNGEKLDQNDLDQLNYTLSLPPIFKNPDFYKNNPDFYKRPCEICKDYYVASVEQPIKTQFEDKLSSIIDVFEILGTDNISGKEQMEKMCEALGVPFDENIYQKQPEVYRAIEKHIQSLVSDFQDNIQKQLEIKYGSVDEANQSLDQIRKRLGRSIDSFNTTAMTRTECISICKKLGLEFSDEQIEAHLDMISGHIVSSISGDAKKCVDVLSANEAKAKEVTDADKAKNFTMSDSMSVSVLDDAKHINHDHGSVDFHSDDVVFYVADTVGHNAPHKKIKLEGIWKEEKQLFSEKVKETKTIGELCECFNERIRSLNDKIMDQGAASTFVAVVPVTVDGEKFLFVAQIGDSVAYQISSDGKEVNLLAGVNRSSLAGSLRELKYSLYPVTDGDYFLLGSDGMFDYLAEGRDDQHEITRSLKQITRRLPPSDWLTTMFEGSKKRTRIAKSTLVDGYSRKGASAKKAMGSAESITDDDCVAVLRRMGSVSPASQPPV
jgi:O-acetyl-ADP-ribose deacetylase (regulator of RNase III)